MNRVVAVATALLTIGFAVSNDAKAEVSGSALTQRPAANQLPTAVKQARIETSGAKTFIIHGRRVLVPSDANAEAVIKALKARYPGLQADVSAQRVLVIDEK